MDYFGVDEIFTPENPVYSKKGAVVTNIAHIPDALSAVMDGNCTEPDFEPRGTLSLKCWVANNHGIKLPPALDVPVVEAVSPYSEQIALTSRHVGAQFPREALKDASGASMMDPKSQITRVHNVPVLDASRHTFEENLVMSLTRSYPDKKGTDLANIALNAAVNQHGGAALAASDAARENGSSPNTVLSAAAAVTGRKKAAAALEAASVLVNLFQHELGEDPFNGLDLKGVLKGVGAAEKNALLSKKADRLGTAVMKAVAAKKRTPSSRPSSGSWRRRRRCTSPSTPPSQRSGPPSAGSPSGRRGSRSSPSAGFPGTPWSSAPWWGAAWEPTATPPTHSAASRTPSS